MKYFSEGRTILASHTTAICCDLIGVTILASAANFVFLNPADSALVRQFYTITLLGKYLCYAMLALAVEYYLGLLRVFELGSGAFFALGGTPWA